MTLFEYLSVAVSIVLSLGLIRLITGLRLVGESNGRHWIPTVWICILIGLSVTHWWTSWSFREAEWTFSRFVLMLSGPAILYFIATILVPDDPKSVSDWQALFSQNRVPFYSSLTAYMALITIDGYLILGAPLLAFARLGQAAGFILATIGLALRKPAVDAVVAVLFGALLMIAAFTLIASPDAITNTE